MATRNTRSTPRRTARSARHGGRLLILFTRYPAPGTVKTRLIPALGPDGAARLHREMTERTLAEARRMAPAARIEIAFTGAARRRIRAWLASPRLAGRAVSPLTAGREGGGRPSVRQEAELSFSPQRGNDLGARMAHAFSRAFRAGFTRVLIIGTDCPGLTPAILARAFRTLQRCPVVLGPAADGGYYLIGLRGPVPELFRDMPWGTSRVFARTVRALRALGIPLASLPRLADVDRPRDLAYARFGGRGTASPQPRGAWQAWRSPRLPAGSRGA